MSSLKDLINLHDSFKHDVNEFTFTRMMINRDQARKDHTSDPNNAYSQGWHTGYEQAIIDIQNWLMLYSNAMLDSKKG